MRILQIISSGGLYGAEQVVLNLARHLEPMGQEGQIVVFENLRAPNLHIAEAAAALYLPVQVVPCQGRFDWAAVARLRSLVEGYGPDVVHMHGYKADMYGYAAVRRLLAAKASTCHGWGDSTLALRAYDVMDRWVLRRFDLVVAVSAEIAERLRRAGVPPSKIRVIENGIEVAALETDVPTLRRDLGFDSKCLLVGAVGRLSPEKGFDILVAAARIVVQQHPEVKFVVVGDGPERKRLEELARQCGLEGKLFWAGRREDMAGVYASFDIQVQPSWKEGLPMTILEGLGAGKPIVATRVGAVGTVINDGQAGLLVDPGSADEIASAVARLIQDSSLRTRLGQAGRARVQADFSATTMAEKYLLAYGEMLKSGSLQRGKCGAK
jgi:glycosyltransferase involved in cell wall biosynthesis